MMNSEHSPIAELNELIMFEYPYPIAMSYQRLLGAEGWEARTRRCIEVFEFGLRTITLGILSQYLLYDVHDVSDPELDRKLYRNLAQASLGHWVEFFFLTLKAYRGKRKLLFMPELYDLCWDTSQEPHRIRRGVRDSFDRLVQIRNDLAHRLTPDSEKDLETLAQEALSHLQTVLEQFRFLQQYDLIRIVNQKGEEYEYERFTGQQITTHREKLRGRRKDEELRTGWFYLSRQDHCVLQLHPLFVFWANDQETDLAKERRQDAAVYDRLLKEAVEYVATVVRQMVKKRDSELLAQVRGLLYYNIEHIKMARKRTILSWAGLRQAAAELTALQMGTVQEKHQRGLYLQREETLRKFQDFLASDKGCFVLTGKSGVGKSNFVLSLSDEFADREDVCLLIYNGARLNFSEGMIRTITQDLARYLTLEGQAISDLFMELEQRGEMVGKTMIVIFDAINENVESRMLLRQIDRTVGEMHYPWLRVVITSRPQAWLAIKKGLPLAEGRYYHERGSDEHWVELHEFSVRLEPFQEEELSEVYEKYRNAYRLQTQYCELKTSIQNTLRDPLVLWLVAEIYRDQAIPSEIAADEIYDLYLQALLQTGRLYEEDIRFLEQELIPLMLSREHHSNRLTALEIQNVVTQDQRSLWELVRNDSLLSSGRRVNESYLRLIDSEILTESGSPLDFVIGFKYERFYEFFGGRRLWQIVSAEPDRLVVYQRIASCLPDHLFLRGILVEALCLELLHGEKHSFGGLMKSSMDDPLLRGVLVSTLVHFGKRRPEDVGSLTCELLGSFTPAPRSFFSALWRLLHPIRTVPSNVEPSVLVALAAASQLRMVELLVRAAADDSPNLRRVAAQNIFYLWQQDNSTGFEALDRLSSDYSVKCGLPHLGTAESIMEVSIAILGKKAGDWETTSRLLEIGRKTLRHILFLDPVQEQSAVPWRAIRRFLHRRVLRVLLRFTTGTLGSFEEHADVSFESLGHVFDLSPDQKDMLRSLLPLLRPTEAGLAERFADICEVLEWKDQIADAIVTMLLLGHGVANIQETSPLLRGLLARAVNQRPPRVWILSLLWALWHIAQRLENPPQEIRQLVEEGALVIQEDPTAWLMYAKSERPVDYRSDSPTSGLASLVGVTYAFERNANSEVLDKCLQKAVLSGDSEYLRLYITHELTIVFESGLSQAALLGLQHIVTLEDRGIREASIALLTRIRHHDPEAVESMMLEGGFPHEIMEEVLARPPLEQMSQLMTVQLGNIFDDLLLFGPIPLQLGLQWVLAQTLHCKNLQEWLTLVGKEFINYLAGEQIYTVPDDAPSSRLMSSSEEKKL